MKKVGPATGEFDHNQNQNNLLQSRLDELEDRERRDNLLFYGIFDAKESWDEYEKKIFEPLGIPLSWRSDRSRYCARSSPGPVLTSRCRPIIVTFANFKKQEKVFSGRSKLSEHDIRVSGDLPLGTRQSHKTLIEFAKSQANNPTFKLKYKKSF